MRYVIGSEAMRFQFLLDSDKLTAADKQAYQELINISSTSGFSMSDNIADQPEDFVEAACAFQKRAFLQV